jgi:hypothetical protein
MEQQHTPRALTHDEQKAAEAAFVGRPFNPAWSASAKKVYEGLLRALPQQPDSAGSFSPSPERAELPQAAEPATQHASEPVTAAPSDAADSMPSGEESESAETMRAKREEAIRSGFLIDVTDEAKKVGLTFPVTLTRPLWDVGIATSGSLSEQEQAHRLRDVLMAFRLRLANQATLSPLIDFPALLALPPGSVPQPIPLFALIQPDERHRALVTLLLPNEVTATIIPVK